MPPFSICPLAIMCSDDMTLQEWSRAQEAFAAYFHAWADTDFIDEITGQHPVKVLVGEHDPTFSAELMTETYLHRYPLATVEVIKNAGHYPMNETPLSLTGAIESFLSDHSNQDDK